MTKPGERVDVDIDGQEMTLTLTAPKEPALAQVANPPLEGVDMPKDMEKPKDTRVTLEAYDENDPFADTDLPVKLDDE